LIVTLFITLLVEGLVVTGYSLWRKKAIYPLLLTSSFVNVVTQVCLWMILILFFQHYLLALAAAEILIWAAEGILLHSIPANRLGLTEAFVLSLSMNAASLAIGWFLRV
jgi:hypothetical protein